MKNDNAPIIAGQLTLRNVLDGSAPTEPIRHPPAGPAIRSELFCGAQR